MLNFATCSKESMIYKYNDRTNTERIKNNNHNAFVFSELLLVDEFNCIDSVLPIENISHDEIIDELSLKNSISSTEIFPPKHNFHDSGLLDTKIIKTIDLTHLKCDKNSLESVNCYLLEEHYHIAVAETEYITEENSHNLNQDPTIVNNTLLTSGNQAEENIRVNLIFYSIIPRNFIILSIAFFIIYGIIDIFYIFKQCTGNVEFSYKCYGCILLLSITLVLELVYYIYSASRLGYKIYLTDILYFLAFLGWIVCYSLFFVWLRIGIFYHFADYVIKLK